MIVGGSLVAAVFLLLKFVFVVSVVVGESMTPTLQPWDFCVLRRTAPYEPRKEEIVMFRTADDPPLHLIKRVVGLPGEEVAGAVVPAGKVYVKGDNADSWQGLVATRLVTARLLWHWRWRR